MTGLEGFFGGAKAAAPAAPPPAPEPEPVVEETTEGKEPFGVVEVELPSGIQVYYQAGPKRLYRLRQLLQPKPEYVEYREVPSISNVTKVLDKPGLVDWAEKIGITAVQELLREEFIDLPFVLRMDPGENPDPRKPWWQGDHIRQVAKTKQRLNQHRKDEAADRGNSVHQALEGWAMSGQLADPDVFPEAERGYVIGLNRFLTESRFQARMSEVIVGSVEHEVAGRFDLLGDIPQKVELVKHVMPKSERKGWFEPGSCIVDLKTTAGVYEDHHLQVTGYMGCLVDSGYEPVEQGYVLRTTWDGRYEFIKVQSEWTDFWFLRGLYDSLERIKLADRAERK